MVPQDTAIKANDRPNAEPDTLIIVGMIDEADVASRMANRIESIDVWNFPEIGGSNGDRHNLCRFSNQAYKSDKLSIPTKERMLVKRRSCKSVLG